MTKHFFIFPALMAILPLATSTTQAGRRPFAGAQKSPAPVIAPVKWSLFDFASLVRVASIPAGQTSTLKVAAVEIVAPLQVAAAEVAQGGPTPPRRVRGDVPVVILLVPKPVVSPP